MRTLLTVTAAVLGLSLVGCVGGIDDSLPPADQGPVDTNPTNPQPSKEGKKLFDANVYPVIQAKCGSCHGPTPAGGAPATSNFVGGDATGGYDVIIKHPEAIGGFANTAGLLSKVDQGHQGKSYTSAERTAITDWFAKELSERGGGGGDLPISPTEKSLQDLSSCMTQTNFDTANMAQACGRMQATNNTQCQACHGTGGERFVASQVTTTMFTRVSTSRTFMQGYFMVDATTNAATPTIMVNKPLFVTMLSGTGVYYEHPRLNNGETPDNNQCTQAAQQFLTLTLAEQQAKGGACGPSKLTNP